MEASPYLAQSVVVLRENVEANGLHNKAVITGCAGSMRGSILQYFASPYVCRSVSSYTVDNALSGMLHCTNNVSEIMWINTYCRPQWVGFRVYEYVLEVSRSCFPPPKSFHHRCVVRSKYGLASPSIYDEANLTDDVLSPLYEVYSRPYRCVCLGGTLFVCLQPAPSTTT